MEFLICPIFPIHSNSFAVYYYSRKLQLDNGEVRLSISAKKNVVYVYAYTY